MKLNTTETLLAWMMAATAVVAIFLALYGFFGDSLIDSCRAAYGEDYTARRTGEWDYVCVAPDGTVKEAP